MNKKQRVSLVRIILSTALLLLVWLLKINKKLAIVTYAVAYLIVSYDVLTKVFKRIKTRQFFDENFLMAIATLGAFALGENLEAVAVMLFYQIGELFQSYAVNKSRKNIAELMDIRPDYANIERDGKLESVDPDEIEPGSVIIIQPGEKIPIDGVIISGNSSLDASALTGESVPFSVNSGDSVQSGCINLRGVLKVRTTKVFCESTASKILELVENASSLKSRSEKFISKFARVYTPAVCCCALVLVLWGILSGNFNEWLYRALTFLVVSCPCALVVSIPLSFFAALGGAGRKGILIKGSNFLEVLAKTKTVALDKTGTLTRGVFDVTAVHPEKIDETNLLHLAAHVERYSTHPIADSLRRAYPNEADNCKVSEIQEFAGLGIQANINGEIVSVGNSKLMEQVGARWKPCHKTGTVIHVAIGGVYAGHVVISDVLKSNAKDAVEALRKTGIEKIVMLTGDNQEVAKVMADSLGIKEFHASLMPADKVSKIEEFLKYGRLAFVGDGINDAPVLARADTGIAMGALGSDAAIEAADVVLMNDDPMKISEAIRLAKKCMRIVNENIYLSIDVKLLCLALGAFGLANMWLAVFADVGVMVLAVLNAIRVLF